MPRVKFAKNTSVASSGEVLDNKNDIVKNIKSLLRTVGTFFKSGEDNLNLTNLFLAVANPNLELSDQIYACFNKNNHKLLKDVLLPEIQVELLKGEKDSLDERYFLAIAAAFAPPETLPNNWKEPPLGNRVKNIRTKIAEFLRLFRSQKNLTAGYAQLMFKTESYAQLMSRKWQTFPFLCYLSNATLLKSVELKTDEKKILLSIIKVVSMNSIPWYNRFDERSLEAMRKEKDKVLPEMRQGIREDILLALGTTKKVLEAEKKRPTQVGVVEMKEARKKPKKTDYYWGDEDVTNGPLFRFPSTNQGETDMHKDNAKTVHEIMKVTDKCPTGKSRELFSYQRLLRSACAPNGPFMRGLVTWDTGYGKTIGQIECFSNFVNDSRPKILLVKTEQQISSFFEQMIGIDNPYRRYCKALLEHVSVGKKPGDSFDGMPKNVKDTFGKLCLRKGKYKLTPDAVKYILRRPDLMSVKDGEPMYSKKKWFLRGDFHILTYDQYSQIIKTNGKTTSVVGAKGILGLKIEPGSSVPASISYSKGSIPHDADHYAHGNGNRPMDEQPLGSISFSDNPSVSYSQTGDESTAKWVSNLGARFTSSKIIMADEIHTLFDVGKDGREIHTALKKDLMKSFDTVLVGFTATPVDPSNQIESFFQRMKVIIGQGNDSLLVRKHFAKYTSLFKALRYTDLDLDSEDFFKAIYPNFLMSFRAGRKSTGLFAWLGDQMGKYRLPNIVWSRLYGPVVEKYKKIRSLDESQFRICSKYLPCKNNNAEMVAPYRLSPMLYAPKLWSVAQNVSDQMKKDIEKGVSGGRTVGTHVIIIADEKIQRDREIRRNQGEGNGSRTQVQSGQRLMGLIMMDYISRGVLSDVRALKSNLKRNLKLENTSNIKRVSNKGVYGKSCFCIASLQSACKATFYFTSRSNQAQTNLDLILQAIYNGSRTGAPEVIIKDKTKTNHGMPKATTDAMRRSLSEYRNIGSGRDKWFFNQMTEHSLWNIGAMVQVNTKGIKGINLPSRIRDLFSDSSVSSNKSKEKRLVDILIINSEEFSEGFSVFNSTNLHLVDVPNWLEYSQRVGRMTRLCGHAGLMKKNRTNEAPKVNVHLYASGFDTEADRMKEGIKIEKKLEEYRKKVEKLRTKRNGLRNSRKLEALKNRVTIYDEKYRSMKGDEARKDMSYDLMKLYILFRQGYDANHFESQWLCKSFDKLEWHESNTSNSMATQLQKKTLLAFRQSVIQYLPRSRSAIRYLHPDSEYLNMGGSDTFAALTDAQESERESERDRTGLMLPYTGDGIRERFMELHLRFRASKPSELFTMDVLYKSAYRNMYKKMFSMRRTFQKKDAREAKAARKRSS